MPRIQDYTTRESAQVGIPSQTAQASDFGGPGMANLGAALIETGGTIGRAARVREAYDAHKEVNQVHVRQAELTARGEIDLQKAAQAAPVGDDSFVTQFNETLKTRFDETAGQFSTNLGKQAWERAQSEMGGHFLRESSRMAARLAGEKATQDFAAMVDADQVIVSNKPELFMEVKTHLERAIGDLMIPPEKKAEVGRLALVQLANSAMEGVVRDTPEYGMSMLNHPTGNAVDPTTYLTGEHFDALKTKAKAGIDAHATLKERQYLVKHREEQDHNEAVYTEFVQRMLTTTNERGGRFPSDAEFAVAPFKGPHAGDQMQKLNQFRMEVLRQRASNLEEKEHPAEVRTLIADLVAAYNAPSQVPSMDAAYSAFMKGVIGKTDLTFVEARYKGLKSEDTRPLEKHMNGMMHMAQQYFVNALENTMQFDKALSQFNVFQRDAYAFVEQLRKAGKDPQEVFDPKTGFFTQARLKSYVHTPGQALQTGATDQLNKDKHSEAPQVAPKSPVPTTALDAFASLSRDEAGKALQLYEELHKPHVTSPGPPSTAFVDYLKDRYRQVGIPAAEATLFANEAEAKITEEKKKAESAKEQKKAPNAR